jgi:hypothetical protein
MTMQQERWMKAIERLQEESCAVVNRLFVSKYEMELPGKDELVRFLEEKRREGRIEA